uniref:Coiled-coil domain-containing protein 176 n=1 Tax=Globodera pallida TaxID=36090 RepID=A0A183CE74_GLOPA
MKMKEEMKNAKLEHENNALRAELAHQKLLNAHMTLQTMMEEYQNKQQQNFDDLTEKLKERKRKMDESLKSVQTMVDAELEAEKQSNAIAEIEQKSGKLEKYQKEEQLNIVRLQKTVATLKIGLSFSVNIKQEKNQIYLLRPNPSKSMGFHGMSPDSRSLSSID